MKCLFRTVTVFHHIVIHGICSFYHQNFSNFYSVCFDKCVFKRFNLMWGITGLEKISGLEKDILFNILSLAEITCQILLNFSHYLVTTGHTLLFGKNYFINQKKIYPSVHSCKILLEFHSHGAVLAQVVLVRWNEPFQKLATCDMEGGIFVWIQYEGRWSVELVNDRGAQVC